jgi:hypothetical protein
MEKLLGWCPAARDAGGGGGGAAGAQLEQAAGVRAAAGGDGRWCGGESGCVSRRWKYDAWG